MAEVTLLYGGFVPPPALVLLPEPSGAPVEAGGVPDVFGGAGDQPVMPPVARYSTLDRSRLAAPRAA